MNLSELPEQLLTTDQENDLASQSSDWAREKLVMHSLKEAFCYARKCSRGNLSEGEVLSVCYSALQDAAKNFKPGMIRFFAYAKPYVRGKVIAEFRSRDIVKKCRDYEQLPPTDIEDEDYAPVVDNFHEPDFDEFHAKEVCELLKPLMRSRLSDKERMILELKYAGGMTFCQIGELLGTTKSDSHHCATIALEKLRRELGGRGLSVATL